MKQRLLTVTLVLSLLIPGVAFAQDEPAPAQVSWKDGFKVESPDKDFSLKVSGRLHLDGRFPLSDESGVDGTFRVRRIRIVTSGRLFEHFIWKVEPDFAGSGSVQEAFVGLDYIDDHTFYMGNFKEPFGLETLTSDNWVKLIERSMASNSLSPSYDVGAEVKGKVLEGRIGYGVGIFNGNGGNAVDENGDKDFAGRLVIKPFAPADNEWINGIQVGVAVTWGNQSTPDIGGSGVRTQLGSHVYDYAAGVARDGARSRIGFEGAWLAGPFSLSGEYITLTQRIDLAGTGATSAPVTGWYATVSYVITGEDNVLSAIAPNRPFRPGTQDTGPGAWEAVVRVGGITASDDLVPYIVGEPEATQFVLGVNWYPENHVRMSANYQRADYGDVDEDSVMLRLGLVY